MGMRQDGEAGVKPTYDELAAALAMALSLFDSTGPQSDEEEDFLLDIVNRARPDQPAQNLWWIELLNRGKAR